MHLCPCYILGDTKTAFLLIRAYYLITTASVRITVNALTRKEERSFSGHLWPEENVESWKDPTNCEEFCGQLN